MGEKKRREENKPVFVLGKKNYRLVLIGLGLIALGFLLMSGGGSDDPEVFNPEIYNWRRTRLAPALVLIGFALQAYAILFNPKKEK